jgi:DNA-directed RNA polymerase specialized sigma24 family protein
MRVTEVVLSAEEHFEGLREAVWVRYTARHRGCDRERFEDLYAEWWAREVERAANGAPSRASAPVAFVAEAVHRVFIDDVRARARGLSREDKHTLDLVDLDGQLDAAGDDDTAASATYEAIAHRILTLVQGKLTDRETRVFVWSYLYLQPSERTAEALRLSVPRVKKDRKRIATKVGAEVWAVLGGELDLCGVYEEQSLAAIFEILTVHAEDCPTCRAALGGVRRGALAIIGPELLVLGTASQGATHGFADLLQGLAARLQGAVQRGAEMAVAVPAGGKTAAAVAVAAAALAGGAVTIQPQGDGGRDRAPRAAVQAAARHAAPAAAPTAVATTPPPPAPVVARPARRKPNQRAEAAPAATATPAPVATVQQPVAPAPTAPAPTAAPAAPAPAPVTQAPPAPPPPTTEFGFEQP